jgi:primosomal protein N' (replication factor Y)
VTALILRLAIPTPLRRCFDYLPPPDCTQAPAPGVRLRVPFGQREVVGILLEVSTATADDGRELRRASAIIDSEPLIPPDHLALLRWAAAYYQHPVGEALLSGLPQALRRGRPLPDDAWRLSQRGRGLPEQALRRAPRQAEALRLLRDDRTVSDARLRACGIGSAALRELRRKALVERCREQPPLPSAELRCAGPLPTTEQAAAIEALRGRDHFCCHLLQGITGSGKTEVYLELIADCLARGRQALVLVPEIGLTPQTVERFRARFAAPVAVIHSGLSDSRRLQSWLAGRDGAAGVVIGTRSAVFVPLARPGLLIVDEEHDGSYKQQDGFRYSARDVAVKRGQLQDFPVLLGSATPSLESLANVARGRYGHSRLQRRVAGGAVPDVTRIDLRGRPLQGGISEELMRALKQCTDERGEQALLYLNRRGYAPTLQCHACGWVAGCEHCDARLTVHLRRRQLRCHHCAARHRLPSSCPLCGGALLTQGLGTEQTEEVLRRNLHCPILRVDSDSVAGPEQLAALLEQAHRGDPCVLLGTQMLTKGHHLPQVQLVGIIDTDALLFSADFRGEERLIQQLVQVAGRAGRERAGARVILQTHHPEHPLLRALDETDYGPIAAQLLQRRRAAGLPPQGQLSLLRCDSRDDQRAEAFLDALRHSVAGQLPAGTRLVGPLPSAMPRRAGRFRAQLWCLTDSHVSAGLANAALVAAAEQLPRERGLSWFLDVDAQDVL